MQFYLRKMASSCLVRKPPWAQQPEETHETPPSSRDEGLLSIFPSIKVFSNESALHIRWPKYWSFNISISPSNEYSGLISFWIDQFDLAVQGTILY